MKIEFLGYIIIKDKIKINLEKVRVIREWSVSKSVKNI